MVFGACGKCRASVALALGSLKHPEAAHHCGKCRREMRSVWGGLHDQRRRDPRPLELEVVVRTGTAVPVGDCLEIMGFESSHLRGSLPGGSPGKDFVVARPRQPRRRERLLAPSRAASACSLRARLGEYSLELDAGLGDADDPPQDLREQRGARGPLALARASGLERRRARGNARVGALHRRGREQMEGGDEARDGRGRPRDP